MEGCQRRGLYSGSSWLGNASRPAFSVDSPFTPVEYLLYQRVFPIRSISLCMMYLLLWGQRARSGGRLSQSAARLSRVPPACSLRLKRLELSLKASCNNVRYLSGHCMFKMGCSFQSHGNGGSRVT